MITFSKENHTYTLDGKVLTSVSSWISQFTPDFPAEMIAKRCAVKDGCTPDEILKKWEHKKEISLHLGNWVHSSIEYYLKQDKTFSNMPVEAFKRIATAQKYHSEVIVHDDVNAGTIDLIEPIKKGEVVLHDFKTNADLNKKNGKLLGRYKTMANTPLNKYTLQLNKYKQLLEKMTGVKVVGMNLWHYIDGEFKIFKIKEIEI